MNEFNNRISAQRDVLELINCNCNGEEQLFGLSKKAIDRWRISNSLQSDSRLYGLLISAADVLFFLANKSQEQVTEEYRGISENFSAIVDKIRSELGQIRI